MKWYLFIFLFCLLTSTILKAEERDSLIIKQVILHGIEDTKDWVLSPIKWEGKDWALFGGVTAATGAMIAWGDRPVYDFANTLHSPFTDKLSPFIEPLGNYYLIASFAGFFLHGLIAKSNYSIETSLIASESLLLSTLLVQTVKNSAGRNRPNNFNTTNPHQWNGPFFKGNSFYSGHTTAAFSVASVYAYRYHETVWVPILSYGLASLVGMQRIYANRHWSSDVIFGATAGTVTGIFLCKQWKKNTIKFYPTVLPGGAGISVLVPIK